MRASSALPLIALLVAACAGGPPASGGPTSGNTPGPTLQPTPGVGKSVFLLTASAPRTTCDDALLAGVLTRDGRSGLGVMAADGTLTPVRWPFGWKASEIDGKVKLINPSGNIVGGEGDTVEVGGSIKRAFWEACNEFTVTPAT